MLLNIVLRFEIYPSQTTRVGKKNGVLSLIPFDPIIVNYPLVSNNVGIDFTELGPPYGSKPGGTTPSSTTKPTPLVGLIWNLHQ